MSAYGYLGLESLFQAFLVEYLDVFLCTLFDYLRSAQTPLENSDRAQIRTPRRFVPHTALPYYFLVLYDKSWDQNERASVLPLCAV